MGLATAIIGHLSRRWEALQVKNEFHHSRLRFLPEVRHLLVAQVLLGLATEATVYLSRREVNKLTFTIRDFDSSWHSGLLGRPLFAWRRGRWRTLYPRGVLPVFRERKTYTRQRETEIQISLERKRKREPASRRVPLMVTVGNQECAPTLRVRAKREQLKGFEDF